MANRKSHVLNQISPLLLPWLWVTRTFNNVISSTGSPEVLRPSVTQCRILNGNISFVTYRQTYPRCLLVFVDAGSALFWRQLVTCLLRARPLSDFSRCWRTGPPLSDDTVTHWCWHTEYSVWCSEWIGRATFDALFRNSGYVIPTLCKLFIASCLCHRACSLIPAKRRWFSALGEIIWRKVTASYCQVNDLDQLQSAAWTLEPVARCTLHISLWGLVFSRPYLRSRLCCLSVVCTKCIVAKRCVLEQKLLLTAYS